MTTLLEEYSNIKPIANRLLDELVKQLNEIAAQNALSLAVPIEGRVKSWESIQNKSKRKDRKLNSLQDLPDLVGLRLVFVFDRDLRTAIEHISNTFHVIEEENTGDRLDESQFGYQSYHSVVRIPQNWTDVPTFSKCEGINIEVQMRTVAQHAWATASHDLQYKQEGSVPPTVRRSINRVSALLETVDLEFERLLREREEYVAGMDSLSLSTEPLNVDVLTTILNTRLPKANKTESEDYEALIQDLQSAGIVDTTALNELLDAQVEKAIQHDQEIVDGKHSRYNVQAARDRLEKGVFLSHSGLVRQMLEFVGKW